MKLILFRDRAGWWRIRIEWPNGLIFATTEAYAQKWNAVCAAKRACKLMGFRGYSILR